MAGDRTHPSSTVTCKPDDDVGRRGSEPTNGNRQTAQQAEITGIGPHGRDDADRKGEWSEGGAAGRNPAPMGGSSQGHADQKAAGDDRAGQRSAAGHYDVEHEGGSKQ